MKKHRIKIFTLIFLLFSGTLFAAEKEFTVLLENEYIEPGRQTNIELIFNEEDEISIPEMPFMPGIQFQYDSTSDKSSFDDNFSDGYKVYKYTLLATREGAYTIGPLIFSFNNDIYRSPQVILKVKKGEGISLEEFSLKSSDPSKDISKHIFATLSYDKKTLYRYENFIIKLKIFSDWLDITDVKVIKASSGGIISDDFKRTSTNIIEDKGIKYVALEFTKNAFIPETGTFSFGPIEIKCNIARPKLLAGGKIEDLLNDNAEFYYNYLGKRKYKTIKLLTNKISIPINGIPLTGRPEGFSGAIGDFIVEYKIDKDKLKTDAIIEYKTRVSGEGNFNTVSMPLISQEDGCDLVDENKKRYPQGIIFTQYLKVDTSKAEKIPEIKLVYFNPINKDYVTASEGPLALNKSVLKIPSKKTDQINTKRDNKKFISIKNVPGKFFYHYGGTSFNAEFYIIQFFPFILIISALFYKRQRWIMTSDSEKAVYIRASRSASLKISKALLMLKKKNSQAFSEIIFNMIREYMGERLRIPYGNITEGTIDEALGDKEKYSDIIKKIREVLSVCYLSRYTESELSLSQMKELLKKVKQVLNMLNAEKTLRSQ